MKKIIPIIIGIIGMTGCTSYVVLRDGQDRVVGSCEHTYYFFSPKGDACIGSANSLNQNRSITEIPKSTDSQKQTKKITDEEINKFIHQQLGPE